jgi:hypothetical protein
MVYEFITWSFLDMCLFIVLFVKCWNGKNHLILSSIKQDFCFGYILFVFISLDVEHFKVWSFCCSCFCCLSNFPMHLIIVDDIENRIHVSLFLFIFFLRQGGDFVTDCSETADCTPCSMTTLEHCVWIQVCKLLGITILAPSVVWGCAKLKHAAHSIHLLVTHSSLRKG